jgi:predicted acetyltransferase
VLVAELAAVDVDAARALWRHVLDLDLCERVIAWNRPVDDELPLLLADPAHAQVRLTSGLGVRMVDVPTALRARRYLTDGRVILRVADPFRGELATWRLGVTNGMGTCEQVADDPGMELDVADLGALYLGGMSPIRLARAGQIVVHDQAALATLERLLAWPLAPWAPEVF